MVTIQVQEKMPIMSGQSFNFKANKRISSKASFTNNIINIPNFSGDFNIKKELNDQLEDSNTSSTLLYQYIYNQILTKNNDIDYIGIFTKKISLENEIQSLQEKESISVYDIVICWNDFLNKIRDLYVSLFMINKWDRDMGNHCISKYIHTTFIKNILLNENIQINLYESMSNNLADCKSQIILMTKLIFNQYSDDTDYGVNGLEIQFWSGYINYIDNKLDTTIDKTVDYNYITSLIEKFNAYIETISILKEIDSSVKHYSKFHNFNFMKVMNMMTMTKILLSFDNFVNRISSNKILMAHVLNNNCDFIKSMYNICKMIDFFDSDQEKALEKIDLFRDYIGVNCQNLYPNCSSDTNFGIACFIDMFRAIIMRLISNYLLILSTKIKSKSGIMEIFNNYYNIMNTMNIIQDDDQLQQNLLLKDIMKILNNIENIEIIFSRYIDNCIIDIVDEYNSSMTQNTNDITFYNSAKYKQLKIRLGLVKQFNNKDIFFVAYKRMMSERLLEDRTRLLLELELVEVFSTMFTGEFIHTIFTMLNDIKISDNITKEVKNVAFHISDEKHRDLFQNNVNFRIMTGSKWDNNISHHMKEFETNYNVPDYANMYLRAYSAFYKSKFNNRNLSWLHTASKMTVTIDDKFDVIGYLPQIYMLLCFNEQECFSTNDICRKINIDRNKGKILLDSLESSSIINSTHINSDISLYYMNNEFKSDKIVDLCQHLNNVIKDNEKTIKEDKKKAVEVKVHAVDAQIVNIVKKNNVDSDQLYQTVVKQLEYLFPVKRDLFENRALKLIEKEYIQHVNNLYQYIP